MKPTVETCLTINLLNLHDFETKLIVVIDIFRATSTIVAGLGAGIPKFMMVKSPELCRTYKSKGFITAGEQNGQKIPYLDLGNSPVTFSQIDRKRPVALTTTNGAKAIAAVQKAEQVLIGAFLNLASLVDYLKRAKRALLLLCSGWKGFPNIEDTFFAGAVCSRLKSDFELRSDGSFIAQQLYTNYKNDYEAILKDSEHYKRLKRAGRQADLDYALKENRFEIVPQLNEHVFVAE